MVEYERTGDGADRHVYAHYDGLGRRFAKGTQKGQGNVAWTQYAYHQLTMDPLAEYPQTGPPRVNYLYRGRGGAIVAMEEQQGGGPGKEYWFAQDGLGSVAAVTKHSGQSAHEYFYAPFGGIIDDNGRPEDSSNWTDPHNHYLLTGKEWDEEMALYYFGARYYDAATGVWLTQDVYRGQVEQPLTLHRTLYVEANPVNNVDAYGYRVIPNGYGDSGGGSTAVHPRDSEPNPARQDNYPYEWKPERDGSGGGGRRGRNGSGGGGRDEPEDEWGDLTRWLHDGRGLWGGPEPPESEDEVPWWVKSMGAVAESLQSIADPTRNPRTAAFHHAFWGGAKAWSDVFGMMQETSEYTGTAIAERRWEDAIRGEQAILQESWELAKVGPKVAGQFVWGVVTTPVRIFATDIPEFTGAVSERGQGLDRTWDVLFTGTMLAGDVSATYKFAQATGLVDRANRAAENYLSRGTSVAYRDQIRAIMDKSRLSEVDMARLEELIPRDIEQAGGTLIQRETGAPKCRPGAPGEPSTVLYTERPDLFHEWLHFDADRQAGWPGVGEPVEYAPQEVEAYSWQLEHPEILGEHALPELVIRNWQAMLEYWEGLLGSQ